MKIPEFKSQPELIAYLIKNRKELTEMKRASMKFTDHFGVDLLQVAAIKALNTHYADDLASGIIKRTIIGNTYNWMDSHDDVHLDNVFQKSIAERQDMIFHLHDHEQKITSKVGKPISIYEKSVAWADLGIDKPGKTMALFMDSNIMKEWNPVVFGQYLAKEVTQHSVGMIYVKIELAVNDPEAKAEYAVWTKVINRIANQDKAIKQGYFWAVSEAKLIEISGVLAGSNELTPTVDNKIKTEEQIEEKSESMGDTYDFLVNKLKQDRSVN